MATEMYLKYKNDSSSNYKYSNVLPVFNGWFWCGEFYIEIGSNNVMQKFSESINDVMYPAKSIILYYR